MKNRPLFTVCLIVLAMIIIAVEGGGEKFIKELRLSPLERNVQEGDILTVCGRVYRIEQKETYRAIYLKDNSIQSENHSFQESNILIYTDSNLELHIGNEITAHGEAMFFDTARNPGNFDQKQYYRRQNIHGMVWASGIQVSDSSCWKYRDALKHLQVRWKEILTKVLGERKGATLSTIMLGDKNGMDQDVKDLYQANGIGHILAISGLHLSLIGLGIYRILRKLTGSYLVAGTGGILFLGMYIMMVGWSVSVVRSFVMFLFRTGADMTGSHYDNKTAIASAGVIVLCWRPLYLMDGGFWMSFGACLAIEFVFPVFQDLPMQSLWGSISIQIVLLPVILYYFFEIPVYSVLLNLYVIPLMSILLFLGMMGSILYGLMLPGQEIIFKICGMILDLYEKSSSITICFPGARMVIGRPELWQIVVYYLLLAAIIVMIKIQRMKQKNVKLKSGNGRKRVLIEAMFLMILGIGILIHRFGDVGTLRITMLDVGQGDGLFIRGPSGGTYLIDGGSSDVTNVGRYRIEPFLKSQGVGKLDYVFISHGDSDHMNGVEELMEREKLGIKIDTLVLPVREKWDESLYSLARKAEKAGICVAVMEPGQKIKEQEMSLTCLQPEKEGTIEPGNAASMVLCLQYGGFDMLFTGDVETEGEEKLMQIIQEQYVDTEWEVLKVAHHGSKNSSSEEFLQLVSPEYALISAGRKNRYGHPHVETVERLEQADSRICSTQESGAVTVRVKKNIMTVEFN